MDKAASINIFDVRRISRDFTFKISAGDVYGDFLYLGDQKGNLYSYPFRPNESEAIPKSTKEQIKNITKSKVDKVVAYQPAGVILVLSDEKLFAVDSALGKIDVIASKILDFAVNQYISSDMNPTLVIITRKREGAIYAYRQDSKRFEETRLKFQLNEEPIVIDFMGSHVFLAFKKQYQSLSVDKGFAPKKALIPPSKSSPFLRVTGPNEVLIFGDEIGIFMDGDFNVKQKDSLAINRPVSMMTFCQNYCAVFCEGLVQMYSICKSNKGERPKQTKSIHFIPLNLKQINYQSNLQQFKTSLDDPKRFSLAQQLTLPNLRGVTGTRPFLYGKEDLFFLYEIPCQLQVRNLLQRCRVDEALNLLSQSPTNDLEAKLEQTRIDAVWPLIRRMQLDKAKQMVKSSKFDIRQIILLFPEMVSLEIDALKSRAEKTVSTMIMELLSEKQSKSKDEETELRKKSKLFLKEVLELRRIEYLGKGGLMKLKIDFASSRFSPVKVRLPSASPEELLEIIDYTLLKWFFEMSMLKPLEDFLSANPNIFCKRLFPDFDKIIKSNTKIVDIPTLKPRLFSAFGRCEEAYDSWCQIAEASTKDQVISQACEEAVRLLGQFHEKNEVLQRWLLLLRKRPAIAMGFFSQNGVSFIAVDEVIRLLENQKSDHYLQLYLETIVYDKKTEVEAYHTKLMLLYLQSLFKVSPQNNKDPVKSPEVDDRLKKIRKLLKYPDAKFASEPILKRIDKCQWLLEEQITLYSRERRHEDALKRYISKEMSNEAEEYCRSNKDKTLTLYFRMLMLVFKSYEKSKNSSALLQKSDIITFLKKYSSDPELDPLVVLQQIPENWMLNDYEGVSGIYSFLESAIIHTLHQKRAATTAKHLSEMDLLNSQYKLIEAKRAYLRFSYKKKCCICQTPISDKFFVVYPNANICHQACVKKEKNTVCPITKQDFEKTFKY